MSQVSPIWTETSENAAPLLVPRQSPVPCHLRLTDSCTLGNKGNAPCLHLMLQALFVPYGQYVYLDVYM